MQDKLIVDEDTGLLYGFGFDDVIELKKREKTKSNLGFAEEIAQIFTDLSFFQKDELIYLHRFVLAKAMQANYLEKAKLVLFDTILHEALQSNAKRGSSLIETKNLLKKSDWEQLSVLSMNSDHDKLLEKIKTFELPEEKVKSIAMYLAKEQVKKNVLAKAQCKHYSHSRPQENGPEF